MNGHRAPREWALGYYDSTNLACYFVELRPGFGWFFAVSAVLSSTARRTTRGITVPAASRQIGAPANDLHYQSNGSDIIDHSLGQAASDAFLFDAALVDGIIRADTDAAMLAR